MNSRGSLQLETWIIIACVVGVFAVALIFAFWSNTKRSTMFQDFAKSRGGSYSRTDAQGMSATIEAYFADQRFRPDNIVTLQSGLRRVVLFDCEYHYRENRRGGNFGTACLIESGRFRSVRGELEIVARTWVDAALLANQVEIGNAEFATKFIVLSQDPASARRIVTPAMQEILLAHARSPLFNPVRIAINATGAVVLTNINAERERWDDLVELAHRLESSLP